MDDMKLPEGKTCSDCRNWARCKKFIGSLTGKETTCDWAPSRFEESNESLMKQIESQNKFITDVQDQRDAAYELIDTKDALIESQKEDITRWNTIRPEVQWFAEQMEKQLQRHEDRGGWNDCNDSYLIREVFRKANNLLDEVNVKDVAMVIKEAANVANFAMMIADNAKGEK